MCKNVLFMLFFCWACNEAFAMVSQEGISARDKMSVCFQDVKEGNLHEAYSLFISAISDKDDDPGYYPELSCISKLCISNVNFEKMWNEYGITDYARGVFLKIPANKLKKSLQAVVGKGVM